MFGILDIDWCGKFIPKLMLLFWKTTGFWYCAIAVLEKILDKLSVWFVNSLGRELFNTRPGKFWYPNMNLYKFNILIVNILICNDVIYDINF